MASSTISSSLRRVSSGKESLRRAAIPLLPPQEDRQQAAITSRSTSNVVGRFMLFLSFLLSANIAVDYILRRFLRVVGFRAS